MALPRNLDHLASTSSLLICTLYICELKEENSKENQHPLLLVSSTRWSDDKSYTFGLLSFTFIFACSSSSPRAVNYRVLNFSTSQSAITLLAISVRFLGWLTLWLASATFLEAISDLVFPLGCLVDMSNLTCQTESHWLILKISRIWLFTAICTAACAIWFTIMSGVDYFSNSYSSPYFHFCLQRACFPHITLSDPVNNLDLISLFSDFPNGSFFFSE